MERGESPAAGRHLTFTSAGLWSGMGSIPPPSATGRRYAEKRSESRAALPDILSLVMGL